MSGLTARVIGATGRMGREHVAAFEEAGVAVVDGSADIVSIASPDQTHANYVVEALSSGSHVFCEKPIATTEDDFNRILKVGAFNGRVVWQHFPLRYQPIFLDVNSRKKTFGTIYRIEASYNWGRTGKLFEGWRKDDPDYSLVMGGLIHMIDLVHCLTEQTIVPCSVAAVDTMGRGKWDTVTALCQLENDGICLLTVDGGRGVKNHHHRLLIHGDKGGTMVVNHEPTDKRVMIKRFVEEIRSGDPHSRGLFATKLALEIDAQLK